MMKRLLVWLRQVGEALRIRRVRVVACLGILVIGLFVATIATPFTATRQQAFFDGENTIDTTMTYMRAEVRSLDGAMMTVRLLDGPQAGDYELVRINADSSREHELSEGSIIVVGTGSDGVVAFIDRFRVPALIIMGTLFAVLVLAVGGRRGGTSLAGLIVGILVIGWMIVPLILQGHDAFWVCIAGAYIIAGCSIFIAHGVRRRTVISLLCIAVILAIICVLSGLAMLLASLSGIYDETTFYLNQDVGNLDMQGIIAGGIVIATLGVLDDIVTAQVAVVEELKHVSPKMNVKKLYIAGVSVGREHIASLVNTLALAYAGASLPLILFLVNTYTGPTVMLFNSEYLAVEIVRTLIASAGLVLAVPVSTLTAAYLYSRVRKRNRRAATLAS